MRRLFRRRNRKSRRRNGRRYRRNVSFFKGLFKRNPAGLIGLAFIAAGGYVAHRILSNVTAMVVAKMGASAPPAAAGLGNVALNYAGVIGSLAAAGVGIPLTLKFVDDPNTKQALVAGMVISALQGVVVGILKNSAPGIASFLSGDDTAAKLSAMYGLGQGASIMPRYAAIQGYGEYFNQPQSGYGEYFATPMGEYLMPTNGLGEYFESGQSGLGNYTGNPELAEAAAGYGEFHTPNTNHIDPSSDLDRQLSIAEAAAGVGQAYEAAAGYRGYGELPPYEAQAGFGNIATAPSADTWVPGSSNPQLWSGTREVSRPQQATAETPAGILSTPGGSGILG